jgi:hypothetical protein
MASPGPKTELRDYNGLPTLFIDGKPSPALFYMTYWPKTEYFKAFAEIGVALSSFSCTGDECPYSICRPTWIAENEFDYSEFDERMAIACEAQGTLVMPRVYSAAPKWWMDRYPEECVVYNTEVTNPKWRFNTPRVPSFSSRRWREASAFATCALIDHIEKAAYGDRIMAYHIAGGGTEEYFQWASHSPYCADYSESNRKAFGEWLKLRYETEQDLQRAWADPEVAFETVTVPTKDERDDADGSLFYDPQTKQHIIDYNIFNGEMVVESIDSLARAVKTKTQNSKIVGAFFGYCLGESYWDRLLLDSGHLALGSLLKRESIDFLTSPSGYGERSCGLGSSYFHAPVQSIQRAGKLWLDENDIRTHLTEHLPEEIDQAPLTIAVQQREIALCLAAGTGQWWFDMGSGWYDDAETMAAIKQLNAIVETGLHADRRSCAEIALVLDAESLYRCPPDNAVANSFTEGPNILLNRVGTPVDRLLLDDALEGKDYKLYFMSGCFAMTDAQREKVHQKLLVEGKTVIWVYGSGYIRNGTMTADNMTDLTGIQLRARGMHHRLLVQTDSDLPGPIQHSVLMGNQFHVTPIFDVVDPEAQTWGYLHTTGTVGMACKKVNGANSIYCMCSPIDPVVFRDIARFAGAHVYVDTSDPSYFSRSFIGIHRRKPGTLHLQLPTSEALFDVLNDKARPAARTHDIAVSGDSTAFFFRGTQSQWQALLAKTGR